MKNIEYKALIAKKSENNTFTTTIEKTGTDKLPQGDVLVRVKYSSLNYKDALSATGNPGVTRNYPHTPGIDAAGIIEESGSDQFPKGMEVIVTSYDLGMNTSGGFGQYIRVPKEWIVPLPDTLSLEESMIFGTAGFTAAMSIEKIIQGVRPQDGTILVTGASGGVGSIACGILAHLGYSVTAVSGKKETALLQKIGVETILDRDIILEKADRPLLPEKWAGVVDTVGGPILAAAIKSTCQDGVVTCCGNVASFDLPLNVFPFILRGVSLMGIDSQHCPMERRKNIWQMIATDWKFSAANDIYQPVSLEALPEKISEILKGKLEGRTVVALD